MRIVIVGDGKVGYALADQLNREGHDITVIDNDYEALSNTMNTLDVMGVQGNGASHAVQVEAGVPEADLLIAATSMDEVNMLCCLTAKNLGAKHTIARIRDPDYVNQMQMLKEQFGLSMVINPELETAREISRILKFPSALKVDTFSKGRVELIEYKLQPENPLVGKKLRELPSRTDSKILICAVERAQDVYIPNGDFVLEEGDRIHITGENHNISAFLRSIGAINYRIRSLLIVGGGRISYYLSKMLDERGFQIKIVEKNKARCDELCELLPRVSIIHGDGSDFESLESEGVDNMDAFAALTGIDEENLIMAMVAKYKKIPKVITKVGRFGYLPLLEVMGLDSVVNPKILTVTQITQYVRAMQNSLGSNVKTLHRLIDGKAEAVEFTALEGIRHLGEPLESIRFKKNILIAALVRKGRVVIPHGKDFIQKDDSVILLTTRSMLTDLNDIFND